MSAATTERTTTMADTSNLDRIAREIREALTDGTDERADEVIMDLADEVCRERGIGADETGLDRRIAVEDELRRLLVVRVARELIHTFHLTEWELASGEVDAR